MISFQAPLWLLLLALLPLIRWLHRFRQQARTFASTTLFLWQNIQHHKNSDGAPSKPEPRWILRALLATLLILSLAEPCLQTKNRPSIEVWLDDSLSMFVHEEKELRIQIAMQQLQYYLLKNKASAIQIHSLGNPALVLRLDTGDSSGWPARLSEWTSRPRGEPSPPPATLSPDNNHILLTDGADRALNEWAQSAALQHAIQVGKKTQNIALTRLSLRQPLQESDNIAGLARVDNLGKSSQKTRLVLLHEKQIIEEIMLDLPPSGNAIVTFTIPAVKRNSLYARLEAVNNALPLDPLPLDDSLQLKADTLSPLLRYKKRGSCNQQLMAVLDSHPALIHDKNQVDLIIDCSNKDSKSEQPTLRFHPPRSIQQTTQTAHWHKNLSLQPLHITAGLAYSNEAPALNAKAIPILSANGRLLILKKDASTQTIDSYLDFSDPVFARQAEYPLLIFSLIAQVTGRSLDKNPFTMARDINASRITPFTLSGISASPVKTQTTQTSFTPMLLLASLLVLILDTVLAAGLATRLFHKFGKQGT